MAAVPLLSIGLRHLAESGLTWQTAAALMASFASFLIGVAAVSREVRAWYRPVDASAK